MKNEKNPPVTEERKLIHELRGPLTTMRLNTEVLLSGRLGKLTQEQEEYLKEVYSASEKQVEILNRISDMHRKR